MVTFEVTARKTVDLVGTAGMLYRGYRIVLDPAFKKHADLAEKLRQSKFWREVTESKPSVSQEKPTPPSDGLFPHQRQVLDRLRTAIK